MTTSANEGRGPRRLKAYWWIVIVVAIASGVGLVLFFSVPIFLSPGGGIGEPINTEEHDLSGVEEEHERDVLG
jgi:hypothetical protein